MNFSAQAENKFIILAPFPECSFLGDGRKHWPLGCVFGGGNGKGANLRVSFLMIFQCVQGDDELDTLRICYLLLSVMADDLL